MSSSRRLLSSRNASFAPQLGIKGLVSKLFCAHIFIGQSGKMKFTLYCTDARRIFDFSDRDEYIMRKKY